MKRVRRGIASEPVLAGTAVRLCLYAAVTFGARLSAQQVVAVAASVEALTAFVVRARVKPTGRKPTGRKRRA